MSINCPRDQFLLEMGSFHDVSLHRCLKCQGVMVPQPSLMALLQAMSRELLKTIHCDQVLLEIEDVNEVTPCPTCHTHMEHYGYMGDRRVMIDYCRACELMWLDTRELGAMSMACARTDKRRQELYKDEHKAMAERGRLFDAKILAMATERNMLYGFVLFNALR